MHGGRPYFRVVAGVVAIGSSVVFAAGCGPEPPAEVDARTETVVEARAALGGCVTLQRGNGAEVRDAQLVRRIGTAIATDPDANANFGALSTAKVGSVSTSPRRTWKSLLYFGLPSLPAGATVTSAVVTLDTTNTGDGMVRVKRSLAPWAENQVTYRNFDNAQSSEDIASFQAGPGAGGARAFSITALAQSWLDGSSANNGLVLLEESPTLTISTSEAAAAAARPKLELCYTVPDACSPNPCQNGGQCSNAPQGGYTCQCAGGYTGTSCEVAPVACPCSGGYFAAGQADLLWDPCMYNQDGAWGQDSPNEVWSFGAGVDPVSGQAYCFTQFDMEWACTLQHITPAEASACRAQIIAWGGPMCEEIDSPVPICDGCITNPCQNGGTCNSFGGGTYTCTCPPGFSGTDCQLQNEPCPCAGTFGWQAGNPADPMLCSYNALSAFAYTGQGFSSSFGTGYDFFESTYYCGAMDTWSGGCTMLTITEQQAAACYQQVLDFGGGQCAEGEFNYALSCPFF